jgi:hypothetical protein
LAWLSGLALGLFFGSLLVPRVGRLIGGWLWLKADRGIRKEAERFDREYRMLVESTMKSFEGPGAT